MERHFIKLTTVTDRQTDRRTETTPTERPKNRNRKVYGETFH